MGHPFAVADSGREEHPDQVAEQALGELVAAPAPPAPPCALWKGHRVTLCPEGIHWGSWNLFPADKGVYCTDFFWEITKNKKFLPERTQQ